MFEEDQVPSVMSCEERLYGIGGSGCSNSIILLWMTDDWSEMDLGPWCDCF